MMSGTKIVKKESVGSASIGVGAFLVALGAIFIVLTYFDITPNRQWIFSWATNYIVSGVGVFIGLLLVGYGVHTRRLLRGYVRKVETLTEEKAEQAARLRQKEMALRRTEEEKERKEVELRLTRGKLKATRKKAERRTEQLYKVRGKLGDRSKRLKEIERIAKVKKKK